MESLRFLGASLALGAIGIWGSENFFWIVPHDDLTPPDWLITWIAYAVAAASAMVLVAGAGLGGLGAAFLGGAVLGYLVEGAVVGTIYQGFPFQLVWTPLSWHALSTGGVVLGLGRAQLPAGRMALVWLGLGIFGGIWALYWPIEFPVLPDPPTLGLYLVGLGLIVPLAQVTLDRIGTVPRPHRLVQALAPAVMALAWGAQFASDMNPLRFALPLILLVIWWIARRLGNSDGRVSFGAPQAVWRHCLFLIAPLTTVVLAATGWATIGHADVSNTLAGLTSAAALVWLCYLIWQAARA